MQLKQFYNGKKVLVTGGCGFIGSHLCEKLVELGASVTIIDDLSTGSRANIEKIKHQVNFLPESITDYASCLLATASNEIVFHLAAYTSVPGSVADPQRCHAINVDGTFNILAAAHNNEIKRLVFSSTSAIYGPRDSACIETDPPNPISPYGATKRIGELYCDQFSIHYGITCVMLRYFNVYGERQDPNSQYAAVVAKFTQQLEENKPITIFGDGSQTRDFVSVHKVVEANLIAGMIDKQLVDRQVLNVGSGQAISILQLAEKLKENYPDYQEPIRFAPARSGDVMHTLSNITRLKKLISEIEQL